MMTLNLHSLLCMMISLLITAAAVPLQAAEKLRLEVTSPFIELHTGPGSGYPKHYIAQRGEVVEVQKRRNDWYKVKFLPNNNLEKIGWIHRDSIVDMLVANQLDDNLLAKDHPRMKKILNPRFYLGFGFGQSSTADTTSAYIGYNLTPSFAIEARGGELLAADVQSTVWSINASLTPFDKNWRVAPFFQVGGGGIDNKARGNNSQQNEGFDKLFQVSSGLGILLSKRYRLRFEYRHMNILQSQDDNREIETWQAGFIGYF